MTDWEQEIRELEADWVDDYFPDVLVRDVLVAHYRLMGSDTPFNRRMLVRTVFAGMEGIVNMLKDEFLEVAARAALLSSAEIAALERFANALVVKVYNSAFRFLSQQRARYACTLFEGSAHSRSGSSSRPGRR